MSSIYGRPRKRAGPSVVGTNLAGGGSGSAAIQSTVDPTTSDNIYEIGQTWVNTSTDTAFILTDITAGVATWEEVAVTGSIDHGTLLGLADDDHVQYSLVDGTRAFTGTISGIDPTISTHLATKDYVDMAVTGFTIIAPVTVATTTDLGGTYATTPSNGQITGAPSDIDGVTLGLTDRVLVKDQEEFEVTTLVAVDQDGSLNVDEYFELSDTIGDYNFIWDYAPAGFTSPANGNTDVPVLLSASGDAPQAVSDAIVAAINGSAMAAVATNVGGTSTTVTVTVGTRGVVSSAPVDNTTGTVLSITVPVSGTGSDGSEQNGIYEVTAIGGTSTLTRSSDQDTSAEVINGIVSFVLSGTANIGKKYAIITPNPITLNGTYPDQLIDWGIVGNNDHGALTGLADDDHIQYALLAGRAGGQILVGGTLTTQDLTLTPNSADATGSVIITSAETSTSTSTGALTVTGGVGIGENLNIGGNTVITGTLAVDDIDSEIPGALLIGSTTAASVEIANTGVTTDIQGPLIIEGSLDTNAAGTLTIGGTNATDITMDENVLITDTTTSADKDTGALVVEGGVGIEENLNVGGTITSTGDVSITSITTSTSSSTGALIVTGGVGIEKDVFIGGLLNVTSIDTEAATLETLLIGSSRAAKVEIADTGIVTQVQGNLDVAEGLDVTGNIIVTGTVDGRDVSADWITTNNHISDSTIHFTEASIEHGSISGLGDDDHTQYALLAGRSGGQDLIGGTAASDSLTLESTSNVTKGTIDLKDATRVDDIDTLTGSATLLLGKSSAGKVEIAKAGIVTQVQGNLDVAEGLDVTGNITVTGTVDGRDVSADWITTNNHIIDSTIHFTEASIDHGSIAGLGDDDHTQYLLVAGTRAMTGNLDMGTNNITNVTLVDGVDVSAHASRHLPNSGTDALATAAPATDITSTSVNGVGTANSFARSDHTHAVDATIVQTIEVQTLTNKTLTLPKIDDAGLDNTYNITVADLAANREIALPLLTGNDTFVFAAHGETLTNKTIVGTTNTVGADQLKTTGASVIVSGSAPPSVNDILTATSATTATWQPGSGAFGLSFVSAKDDTTTISGGNNYSRKLRLSTGTLVAGNYYIAWNYQWSYNSTANNRQIEVYVNVDNTLGTPIATPPNGTNISLHTQAIKDVDERFQESGIDIYTFTAGTHTIDVYWRSTNAVSAASIYNTRLALWRTS